MDYIVVLGNGLVLDRNNFKLSPESKITTLASGVLYKEKQNQKIILSGGHTKGKDSPSEATKMHEFLETQFPEIPEYNIILEENSLDTAGNAVEVKKLIPDNSRISLISFGFHLPRAKRIFENFGIVPENIYASDKILKKLSPAYDDFLKKFTIKRKIQKIIRELICAPLAYTIDPKGKILRIITSRTRGGSLDFLPF